MLLDRQQIIDALTAKLRSLPTYKRVLEWDNVPSQYSFNAIYLKDTREKYEKKNDLYKAVLRIELVAVVIEQPDNSASELGNLALRELHQAVRTLQVNGAIFNLIDAFKYVDTKGVTACEVELHIDVKYLF